MAFNRNARNLRNVFSALLDLKSPKAAKQQRFGFLPVEIIVCIEFGSCSLIVEVREALGPM